MQKIKVPFFGTFLLFMLSIFSIFLIKIIMKLNAIRQFSLFKHLRIATKKTGLNSFALSL